MNKAVIILLGYSGSGKDEVVNYLESTYNVPKIHPIDDLKWFLQCHYGYEHKGRYWLDTQEGKNTPINPKNPDYTFQRLMVDEFHFREKVDPYFTYPYLRQTLECFFEKRCDKLISYRAVRRLHEAQTIVVSCSKYDLPVSVLQLKRDSHRTETSDCHYEKILDYLLHHSDRFSNIANNGTLLELKEKIDHEYHTICKTFIEV